MASRFLGLFTEVTSNVQARLQRTGEADRILEAEEMSGSYDTDPIQTQPIVGEAPMGYQRQDYAEAEGNGLADMYDPNELNNLAGPKIEEDMVEGFDPKNSIDTLQAGWNVTNAIQVLL